MSPAKVQIIFEAKDQASGVTKKVSGEMNSLSAGVSKAKASFTEINSALAIAAQGLRAFKAGYDFAREGAQLEFTTVKFDRLAQSIGSTADALLNDLRIATKGTYSDMQLMASATDLVGLGLAKDHQEAVRLAAVSAGLNMDMNQLVLTLTNMTTMRFDALGVQVDGFDAKVKQLEETGMSANEAFKEAFLQQAEGQLKKVGNAADTTLGEFMRLEAQSANLKNEWKMMTAELTADLVPALTDMVTGVRNSNEIREEANRLMEEGIAHNREEALTMAAAAVEQKNAAVTLSEHMKVVKEDTVSLEEQKRAQEEATKAMNEANTKFLGVLGSVDTALDTYTEGISASYAAYKSGEQTLDEHKAKVEELAATYEETKNKIVLSIVEMKLATDGWTDAEMNAYLQVGKKLGVFTEQTVRETQITMAEADKLVKSFSDMGEQVTHTGERSLDAADNFGVLSDSAVALSETVPDASAAVGGLKSNINSLPPSGSQWRYKFVIDVEGRVPKLPNQATNIGSGQSDAFDYHNQQGGEVFAGVPAWVGEAGAERFVPAQNGRILGHAESLHAMTLGGGMGMGGTNYFYGNVTIMSDAEAGGDIMSIR